MIRKATLKDIEAIQAYQEKRIKNRGNWHGIHTGDQTEEIIWKDQY